MKSVKVVHGNLEDVLEDKEKGCFDPHNLNDEWERLQGMIRGTYAADSTLK